MITVRPEVISREGKKEKESERERAKHNHTTLYFLITAGVDVSARILSKLVSI
jgi:hypothetical protein